MMRAMPTLAAGVPPVAGSPIRWVPPMMDDLGDVTIGFYGGWALQIRMTPLSYWLVLAEPVENGRVSYRWRYWPGSQAHVAALAWDPELDSEPANFLKAGGGIRWPGERALWWRPPLA